MTDVNQITKEPITTDTDGVSANQNSKQKLATREKRGKSHRANSRLVLGLHLIGQNNEIFAVIGYNKTFSHDVTAAMLVFPNQASFSPLGNEPSSTKQK